MIPNESLRSAVKASKSGLGCHFPFPRCYAIYTVGDGCEKKQKEVNELSFGPRCPTQEQRASRSVPEGAGRWCEAKPKSTSPSRPQPLPAKPKQPPQTSQPAVFCRLPAPETKVVRKGKQEGSRARPHPFGTLSSRAETRRCCMPT